MTSDYARRIHAGLCADSCHSVADAVANGWQIFQVSMPLRLVSLMFERLPRRGRAIVRACLYGLGGGGAAVAFQLSLNWVYQAGMVRLSHQSLTVFFAGSAVLMLGTSLVVGWLLHAVCPEAAGSGIPQLKYAYWKASGWIPFRVVWVKFLAGVISIGGGTSLGREGPSVQLAGAIASTIAGGTGEAADHRRVAAAARRIKGLAAAFNMPLRFGSHHLRS